MKQPLEHKPHLSGATSESGPCRNKTWQRFKSLKLLLLMALLCLLPGIQLNAQTVDGDPSDWPTALSGATIKSNIVDPSSSNTGGTDNIFTGGSSDVDPIANWTWTSGGANGKNDLGNTGVILQNTVFPTYTSHKLYFFADRYAVTGDAALGIWIFKNGVAPVAGGGFSGAHQDGDILLMTHFVNGGSVADRAIYRWDAASGTAVVVTTLGVGALIAQSNATIEPVPSGWTFSPKAGTAQTYPPNSFVEGMVDLDSVAAAFGTTLDLCFATYVIETKNSQSLSASLEDLVAGRFGAIPLPLDLTGNSYCSVPGTGASITSTTSESAVTYQLYNLATGLPVQTTKPGNGSGLTWTSVTAGNYYVIGTNNATGCESSSDTVAVVSNPSPAAPTAGNNNRCGTGTVTISATGGTDCATVTWYAAATGGTALATGTSFTTPSISTTTNYWASCTSTGGCEGARTMVTATVNAVPAAPTAGNNSRCGTGTVVLTATGGAGCTTITWYAAATGGTALGTGSSFTTPSISTTTSYWASCTSAQGCEGARTQVTATVNAVPAAPIAGNNSRCGTGTVVLTATGGTDCATITWYAAATGGAALGTGSSFTTPSISTTTSYWASCTSAQGCEGARTMVTATVNAIPAAPTAGNNSRCGTGTVVLTATGGTDCATITWYAAATGGTALGTGSSFTTPSISTTTSYWASCTSAQGCEGARTQVTATVNAIPAAPTAVNNSRCGTGTVTIGATGGAGCTTITWYSAATGGTALGTGATFTTPSISTTTSYWASCTSAQGCEGARTQVTATVNAIPAAPTAGNNSRCGTGTVTLTATGGTDCATITWYAAATGGTALGTGSSFTTPSISTTTSYWASCTSQAGCEGARTQVTATINAIPAGPTAVNNSRCGTGTLVLGATAGANCATITWYAAATGGTALGTGATFTTPSISTTTSYWASCTSAQGCEGARTQVTATVNAIPAAPTAGNNSRCGTGTVVLTATGGTDCATITWYSAATGGTVLGTGASFTTPSISTTTSYWASCTSAQGCEGARTQVTATVNAIPAAPTAGNNSRCGTGTVVLTATGGTDCATITWYAAATGGAALGTGSSFTTPSISTTTSYWASCTSAQGCEGARTMVTATINAIPAAPTAGNNSRCGTGTVVLTATGGTDCATITWYSAATGGTVLGTGASFTTPSISTTTSYWASCTSAQGCEGARTQVTATINVIPAGPTAVNNSRCGTGTVVLGATAGANCATITWYAAATGGTALGTGATFTTPSISTTTSYWASCTSAQGCEGARTQVTATVNAIPAAPTAGNNSRCGTGTVVLTATGGTDCATITWYSAATGGTVLGTGASFTTPSISTTTSYWASCTSAQGCEGARTMVTATINAIPAAPTAGNNSRCGTGTVTLTATGGTDCATITWYAAATGGTALGTGSSFTTPSISTTTSYWASCTSQAGCEGARTMVTATVNAIPAAPTAGNNSRCGTGTVVLTATGGTDCATITWYAAATGGTALGTGSSFTTPSISTTTSYWASCTSAQGCEGARTQVTATINVIPAGPTAVNNSRCGTGTVVLGATAGANCATITWYAAATGGTALGTGATFTTPSISTTTSYWASCTSAQGCEGARTQVTATVNAIPAAPTAGNNSRCGTGTVVLTATGGTDCATITWYAAATGGTALGTGSSFTTPSISTTTSYWASCTSAQGCEGARTQVTATVNAIPAAPTAGNNSRCGTGTVVLTATGGTDCATITWYAAATGGTALGTGSSFTTPSISTTTSYWASCTSAQGCEGARTQVTATVNAIPAAPTAVNNSRCGTGTVTIGATGGAGCTTITWYSAATGGTVLGTGATFTTPSISTTTSYWASCTSAQGCEGARTQVTATVNAIPAAPTAGNNSRCGTGTVVLTATGGTDCATITWYAAATGGTALGTGSSFTTPSISTTTSYWASCTSAQGCEGARTMVTATINAIPAAPTAGNNSRCGTGTVTLTATGGTDCATITWYAAATGGTALGTGSSFTTPSISTTTSYWASCTSQAGCEGARTQVTATINVIPAGPTAVNNSRCGTGTVVLGATAGANCATITWYAAATGGTALGTGATFTTPSISTTTSYWASCTSAQGCEGARTQVTATVNAIPAAPTAGNNSRCGTGTVVLTATGGTDCATITWYAAATGGTALGTGSSFTTPSISTTTSYWASCTSAQGCEGARTQVTATVNAIPAAPTAGNNSRCGTGTVVLTATGGTDCATITWYAAATGGAALGTGSSFTTPSISTTTSYWASCTSAQGCEGARTQVTATVNAIPAAPTAGNNSRCGTGTVVLTATGGTDCATITWYAAATGGTALGTGSSFTTPSISTTTSYWASCTSAQGCEGARTQVTATVNAIPAAPTAGNNSRCGTGTVTLTATGGTDCATITWYAAATGGTALGTGSSFTTPSISTTTSYWASCTSQAGCEGARTMVTATVNAIPAAPTAGNNSRCGTGTVVLTATGGTDCATITWYAAATGGTALGTGSSFTTPSISTTTSYWASCTSQAGCEGARTQVTATINAIPAGPTAVNNSRCGTGTVVLGATAGANCATITWYAAATGGTALGTGATFTTPSISTTTSYWASCTSAQGCEGARTQVTATVNAIPAAPTAGNNSRCGTGTVVLTATGGTDCATITWYAAATGGTALGTGSSFTTPSISTTTSYWASCTSAQGCEGARTQVTATVNAIPAAPTAGNNSRCGTGTVVLTATGGTDCATITWYAAATGGTALGTGSSFTTPSISTTTSYWASCTSAQGCEGARTQVTATVNAIPAAPTAVNNSRCGTGTVTIGATGGAGCTTITWYSAATGGTVLGTGATFTTPSISTTTSYWASCTSAQGCEGARTQVTATVNAIPAAPTAGNNSRCGTGTVVLTATGGTDCATITWYAAATGGTALGTGSSFTTPSISTTTSYWASCTSAQGCEGARTMVTATINAIPAAPTAGNNSRCGTGTVVLTASSTDPNCNTIRWYTVATGGTPVATGTSFTTPSISATTNYWISCLSTAGCEGTRTMVTATINAIPAAPTAGNATRCGAGTVTITATGGTGCATITWYAAATGGTALATGSSFTTPSISTTTSYWASCTSAQGCEGARTMVTATVNNVTAGAIAGDTTVCTFVPDPQPFTEVTAATGTGVTYQWLSNNDGCGGPWAIISGATASTYDAPSLTDTTYFRRVAYSTVNSVVCTDTSNCITVIVRECGAFFGTYSQGYFGNRNGNSCDGTNTHNNPISLIGTLLRANGPFAIGRFGQRITIAVADSTLINSIMPGNSTPSPLKVAASVPLSSTTFSNNYLNKKGTIDNVLLSQALALKLGTMMSDIENFPIEYKSTGHSWFETQDITGTCGNWTAVDCSADSFYILQNVAGYLTQNGTVPAKVEDILSLTDDLLGGTKTPGGTANVPSYGDMAQTISTIIKAFDGWKWFSGQYSTFLNEPCYVYKTSSSSASMATASTNAIVTTVGAGQIRIYPNPNHGTFTVELPAEFDGASVTVTDVTGKVVYQQNSTSGNKLQINLENVAQGFHLVNITSGNTTYRFKISVD